MTWPDPLEAANNNVDVRISRIRRKLGAAAALLATQHGYGYRFVRSKDSGDAVSHTLAS